MRRLYVLGHEFPDYSAEAAWEDTKLGLGHLRSWERIAIVSDAEWLRRAIHGLGWIMPGEVRIFGLDELDSARDWVIIAARRRRAILLGARELVLAGGGDVGELLAHRRRLLIALSPSNSAPKAAM